MTKVEAFEKWQHLLNGRCDLSWLAMRWVTAAFYAGYEYGRKAAIPTGDNSVEREPA